jgi:hypothetical protein
VQMTMRDLLMMQHDIDYSEKARREREVYRHRYSYRR